MSHSDPSGLTAEVRRYIDDVVARVKSVLGHDLVGIYLYGSAADGSYISPTSDVDIAVIIEGSLTPARQSELRYSVDHQLLPCPARRLELVVYQRAIAAAPVEDAGLYELNVNTGGDVNGTPGDSAPSPHWFVIDLALLRSQGVALVGPPAAEVFGPIAREVLFDAFRRSLSWHTRHEPASPNTVLNACRAWRYAATGEWSSKTGAAAWAVAQGVESDTIATALWLREHAGSDVLDPGGVRALIEHVRAVLEA